MKNILFNGIAGFSGDLSSQIDVYEELLQDYQQLLKGLIYISDKEAITYLDARFVLLVDGVIYRYRNSDFKEAQVGNLIISLSQVFLNTVRDLDGEFTIILADLKERSILIASSETGSAAFFYKTFGSQIVFSNGLENLKELLPGEKSVDMKQVMSVLAGTNMGSEQTCIAGINKLLPGHYMEITKGGIEIREFSNLFESKGKRYQDEEEVFDNFRLLFRESVLKRMRSHKIGFSLSSGKDSTSVAAMTQFKKADDHEFFAYTFKPVFFPEEYCEDPAYDETILLKNFFEKYPGIKGRDVIVNSPSIIESIEQSLKIFGEPVFGISNQYWIQEMHKKLKEDGCEQLFIGQGGNFTISWPPPELTNSKGGLKRIIKKFLRESKATPYNLPFVKEKIVQDYHSFQINERRFSKKIHDLQPIYLKNSIHYVSSLQKQISLYRDLFVTDPTVDKRLIKFCLSQPYSVYYDKQNSRKLVTVALREILPDAILKSRARGIQASDIRYRMEAEKHAMVDKLVFCRTNKIVKFVFEIERLIEEWGRFDFFKMSRREINHLLRVFQVVMFLSKFDNLSDDGS